VASSAHLSFTGIAAFTAFFRLSCEKCQYRKKILDIDQNLPTKDGKGGFAFPFRSHPQTASTKRWSNAVRHFLQAVQKKVVKVAKVAVRHFLQAVQKKVVKVAKVAVRHFLPAVQKKAVKVAKPALPLLPLFFRQV
jgi:hypothetical protein